VEIKGQQTYIESVVIRPRAIGGTMLTRRLILTFLAGLAAVPLFAAAPAGDIRGGARVQGEPPPGATTWILVGPEAAGFGVSGIQLHAALVRDVIEEFNPTTRSVGEIADPHKGFCDCIHYHGEILGTPDPDSDHCGWGCVINFNDAPDAVQILSAAIMREMRTYKKLNATPADDAGAFTDLTDARDDLKEFKAQLKALEQAGEVSERAADKIRADIGDALKSDKSALRRIKRLKDGNGTPRDRRLATKAVDNATLKKGDAFDRLTEELDIP
jgi:hypothetical protein